MPDLVETQRKTSVLKHPTLPCLSRDYTMNLLSGCPYECRYCYTQSFRSHPGWGKIVYYVNTFDLLVKQLPRMRTRPRRVYFSTACEPFMSHDLILEQLYKIMQFLLEHSVSLLISTKSLIPSPFVDLFKQHSHQVHVQVGLTTVDDSIRRIIEPKAPTILERLENLAQLHHAGISQEVRADPLIPELTDTDENVEELFKRVSEQGTRHIVTSYLFLRHALGRPLATLQYRSFSFADMARRLFTETITNYCGNNAIRVVRSDYRTAKYRHFDETARRYGLSLRLCRCKNPNVTDQCCHPQLPAQPFLDSPPPSFGQMSLLFHSLG
jgi:DNA repair photolyase